MSKDEMFKFIFNEDDVRWQSIIYELIRSGKVDPWNVDITKFTKEYMVMLDKFKQMNFRVSGKVVLAAAILLKLKTQHLGLDDFIVLTEEPEEDMALLDGCIDSDEFVDSDEEKLAKLANHIKHNKKSKKNYVVEPKLVGPRKRKVTVFELVGALKKALEVDERRTTRQVKYKQSIPTKKYNVEKVDILRKINKLYTKLTKYLKSSKNRVAFSELVEKENDKSNKIWTFIPLLHLANDEKVWLHQEEPFGKIEVEVLKK